MKTSKRGLALIAGFEGYSSKQYLDSVGVPTIGYGTTASVVNPLPRTCTREQAEAWLAVGLAQHFEPAVNGLGVILNQNQFDALVSLAYNCGPGAMTWQIGTDLKRGNFKAASADFMRYVYAGGRPLQGLINRRAAERKLFDTPASAPAPEPPPKDDQAIVVVSMSGGFEAFVEKADGSIWHRWQKQGQWQAWQSLGRPGS